MTATRLFPAAADRLRHEDALTRLLAAAARRVAAGAVAPTIDRAAFGAELAAFAFEEPVELETLLQWTVAQMEAGHVQMTHPRYLGLFNPAPSFPAQCADRIASAFNPQLASATTSPVPVAVEAFVIRAVAARAGLANDAGGHFTSGGSEANFTALICALTHAGPAFAASGARAFAGQPVFYISRDSHLAWIKIAHMAGIGRDAVRQVATDGCGRMDAAALTAAIAADRAAGRVPVMAVATAGTTNAGMIDPLRSVAGIAAAAGLWFHVDAAWAGALVASERLRGCLAGIERADSVTIDAHKWFAVTMGCGMFLTAHPGVLTEAFNVQTSFMPSHELTLDPYVTTAQWSRRFLGLRLFLSLAAGGWPAYAAHVERASGLARSLAERMRSVGWTVVNDPALAVVCMTPPPGSAPVREVVRRVVASGGAWVSVAEFEGRAVVRACITHGETDAADMAAVASLLERACSHQQLAALRFS